jgi:hypothetical protein
MRLGEWTAGDRHRLTAIGEGTTDLYGSVFVGRAGSVYATWLGVTYYHRFPVAYLRYLGGLKVPGDDINIMGDALVYPRSAIGLGPSFDVLHRTTGVNWGDVQNQDMDRYTALAVTTVKVGGKLSVRSHKYITFNASAFTTLYARNNPGDGFNVGVGVGFYLPASEQ